MVDVEQLKSLIGHLEGSSIIRMLEAIGWSTITQGASKLVLTLTVLLWPLFPS
jgi:hypothetical protein